MEATKIIHRLQIIKDLVLSSDDSINKEAINEAIKYIHITNEKNRIIMESSK